MVYVDEAVQGLKKLIKDDGFSIKSRNKNSKDVSFVVAKGKFETELAFSAASQKFSMKVDKGIITVDTLNELQYTVDKYSWLINVFIDKAKTIEAKFSKEIGVKSMYADVISGKTQSRLIYKVLGEDDENEYIIQDSTVNQYICQLVRGNTPLVEIHYDIEGNLIMDNNVFFMRMKAISDKEGFTFRRKSTDQYSFMFADGTSFDIKVAFKEGSEDIEVTVVILNNASVSSTFTINGVNIAEIENHINNMLDNVDNNKPEKIEFSDDEGAETENSEDTDDTEDFEEQEAETMSDNELEELVTVNDTDFVLFVYPTKIARVDRSELEKRGMPVNVIENETSVVPHKGISLTQVELDRHIFAQAAEDVDALVDDFFA